MNIPASIFKNILLNSCVRETQMSPEGEEYKFMLFLGENRPEVDADFYIAYSETIFRLEITDLDKFGVPSTDHIEVKSILVRGYDALKLTGEFDKIMAMRLYL